MKIFEIKLESEIPATKQLFDQIQFAIASRQYSPGDRLPSTRQLAMITGLHRNTISKVYRQLEEAGLVESLAGSGIYVKYPQDEKTCVRGPSLLEQYPQAKKIIKKSLDELLSQGYTLSQAKELFLAEIDWRERNLTQIFVSVPSRDIEAGQLMTKELEQSLVIPLQLVPLEELPLLLKQSPSATVITSRYFLQEVMAITSVQSVRVIPVDIYDYGKELELIKKLPANSCLGLVSLSAGTLKVAEIIVHSLRGDELLIMSAPLNDSQKLKALIRSASTIICDSGSYPLTKKAIEQQENNLIRLPQLIRCQNYIGEKSINFLKKELGLGGSEELSGE